MLILGAKGHAKEVLEILYKKVDTPIVFFDNINSYKPDELLYNEFEIIKDFKSLAYYFKSNDSKFCSGIGTTTARRGLVEKVESLGGVYTTVMADNTDIGIFNVSIEAGCNIMQRAFISNSVSIGKGSIINFDVALHHDVSIGCFCEISPRTIILGRCSIGNHVSIGANSTILPDVIIGDYAVIGAGAVVTKNVKPKTTVVGIPAK